MRSKQKTIDSSQDKNQWGISVGGGTEVIRLSDGDSLMKDSRYEGVTSDQQSSQKVMYLASDGENTMKIDNQSIKSDTKFKFNFNPK